MRIDHDQKFKTFVEWAAFPKEAGVGGEAQGLANLGNPHVFQLVKQVNYGAVESRRYFARTEGGNGEVTYLEVTESDSTLR